MRFPRWGNSPGRVESVLAVIYLIFNEGYSTMSGHELVRLDLCDESSIWPRCWPPPAR